VKKEILDLQVKKDQLVIQVLPVKKEILVRKVPLVILDLPVKKV
jgi:hypothetical protein